MWSFFHATRSGSHNIADQTDSVIPFNAEVADTDSAFDTSTYRFTVPSGKGVVISFLHSLDLMMVIHLIIIWLKLEKMVALSLIG